MFVDSNIVKNGESYCLRYVLKDNTGKVVRDSLFVWTSSLLSVVLMVEKVIAKHGVAEVEKAVERTQNEALKSFGKKFPGNFEYLFEGMLEKLVIA